MKITLTKYWNDKASSIEFASLNYSETVKTYIEIFRASIKVPQCYSFLLVDAMVSKTTFSGNALVYTGQRLFVIVCHCAVS